jgi:hypothetical protein
VLVDRLQVSYWAAPAASPALGAGISRDPGDSTRRLLVPPGAWQLDFGEPVSLFDITDPQRPVAISPAGAPADAPADALTCARAPCLPPAARQFGLRLAAPHTFAALTPGDVLSPVSLSLAAPPHLHAPANGADYILIAPESLLPAAAPLAAQRRAQGLRVALIDVQAIYDEFGSGQVDAEAIRRFLAYTYAAWQRPAPAYVLLLGDGTFDPRGRCAPSAACPGLVTLPGSTLIPPYLVGVDPWLGETAADSRLAAIDPSSPLPFFAIGRLPANTPAEAQLMVQKLLAYENAPPVAPGAGALPSQPSSLLFVADNAFAPNGSPDPAGNFWQIADAAASLADSAARKAFPTAAQPPIDRLYLNLCDADHFSQCVLADPPYRPLTTGPALSSALGAALARGSLLVHYSGHGSIAAWGGQPAIWASADVQALANATRLPLVVDMTCYTGYFHYPGLPSLAEVWLTAPGGGAVAVIASSGLGLAAGHATLDAALLAHLFAPTTPTVGEALLAAKLAVAAGGGPLEDLDTFALFGDPAMPLHRLHPPPAPTGVPTSTPLAGATPTPGLPPPTVTPGDPQGHTPIPSLTATADPPAPTAPGGSQTIASTPSPTGTPIKSPTGTLTPLPTGLPPGTPATPPAGTAGATPVGTLPLYLPSIMRCAACSGAQTPPPPGIPFTPDLQTQPHPESCYQKESQ